MKKSVVLADDFASIRQMLEIVVIREGEFEVVGEARTGFEALKVCRDLRPDLVIMDLCLPELNGAEVLRRLHLDEPAPRVLIYSGALSRELTIRALQERPEGFVHKRDRLEMFVEALQAVSRGCCYMAPFAVELLASTRGRDGNEALLTDKERAVLQMLAEGMANKEMAQRLFISPKTVEYHRAQLMRKLRLHDVAKLTRYAVREGLVKADS